MSIQISVLLIDDSEFYRELYADELPRKKNLKVQKASSAREGLDLATQSPNEFARFVINDRMEGEQVGVWFANQLIERGIYMKGFILTAHPENITRPLPENVLGLLEKPKTPYQLYVEIHDDFVPELQPVLSAR